MTLTREEQETHLNQTADERIAGIWHVFTDDPVRIRKLNKLGKGTPVGTDGGMQYTFTNVTVSIGKKRTLTPTQRESAMIGLRVANQPQPGCLLASESKVVTE